MNGAYFQCAFLVLQAVWRYTDKRGQSFANLDVGHNPGGLWFYEAPGKCQVTAPSSLYPSHVAFSWVCVSWAFSPPAVINKMLEVSRVELLGCRAWRGEVRAAHEPQMSSAATATAVESSSPSAHFPPPHRNSSRGTQKYL